MAAQARALNPARLLFVAVAVLVFAADRLTKNAVVATIPEGSERAAIPHFLFIQHLQNSCAAFSMCGPLSSNLLMVIAFAVAAGVIYYALRPPPQPVAANAFLGLIAGGTLGNGFDRLLHGSVTDFLSVHWWPTFNVADSAISVGVVLLALGYGLRRQPAA